MQSVEKKNPSLPTNKPIRGLLLASAVVAQEFAEDWPRTQISATIEINKQQPRRSGWTPRPGSRLSTFINAIKNDRFILFVVGASSRIRIVEFLFQVETARISTHLTLSPIESGVVVIL